MKISLLEETTDADRFLCDAAFCVQEKLNGVRLLVERAGDAVRCINRSGKDVQTPAAIRCTAHRADCDFILDGELMPDGGFIAFDCLSIRGEDISDKAQAARFAALLSASPFGCVRTADGAGKAAFVDLIRAENGEGVVFKNRHAPLDNGRGFAGLKFKFWKSESFVVADVNIAKGTVGLTRHGVDCGRCWFPCNARWPKVGEVVEVRFLLRHKSGKLSQPVFLAVRDDLVCADIG